MRELLTYLMIGVGVMPLWMHQFVGYPFENAVLMALGIIAAYIEISAYRLEEKL